MKLMHIAAIAVAIGASPAFAEKKTIKEIDVTLDEAAIENPRAAQYWGEFEGDAEGAILARLTNRIADDGADLTIDIDELELSNGFEEATGVADTRIVASVKQTSETDNSRFNAYEISVDVNAALVLMPVGTEIAGVTWETPELYTALVEAFADAVVERIE